MTNSWKDLPVETLLLILDYLSTDFYEETIHQCAYVCKSWKTAAYYKVYTEVDIVSIASLSKFNRTIVENATVANMVKKVELSANIEEDDSEHVAYVYTLLSNLPNLQHFIPIESPLYIPILNALLDSKLDNLKSFAEPCNATASNNYVTCALLMKNRLETLLLAGEGVLYERLYDRLDQFKKLERLKIEISSKNPIKDLDSIVEKCSTLRDIEVDFLLSELDFEGDWPTVIVEDSAIPLFYAPRPEVNSLSVNRDQGELHQSLLAYVMHKYPNLKRLRFVSEEVELMGISILERLIAYIAKVEDHTIGPIVTNVEWVCDSVGGYWEAISSNQRRNILVNLRIEPISAPFSGTTNALLYLDNNQGDNNTSISFPFSRYNFQDMNLFAKYGQHVGTLLIRDISKKSLENSEVVATLLENLIASAIESSKHLKELSLINCDISRTDESIIFKKARFLELSFDNCNIGDRVLDTFFGGISTINALKFDKCHFRDEHNKLPPFISINMPDTTIGNFKLESPKNPHRGSRYFFLKISTISKESSEREEKYYKYDFEAYSHRYFMVSSEAEYNEEKYFQCLHLKICCRSIISLQVVYLAHTIRLPAASINNILTRCQI